VDVDFDNFTPSLMVPVIPPEIKRIVIDSFRTTTLQKKISDIKGNYDVSTFMTALKKLDERMKNLNKIAPLGDLGGEENMAILLYLLAKNGAVMKEFFNIPLKIKDTKF
jgi:hypothetical protein